MHLVTRIKVITDLDDDGELVTEKTVDEAHVEDSTDDAELIVRRIKAGDHRVTGVRVFELNVDEDGMPSIGTELTA